MARQQAAEQEYIDQQGRAGAAGYGPRAKQLEQLKIGWDNKLGILMSA